VPEWIVHLHKEKKARPRSNPETLAPARVVGFHCLISLVSWIGLSGASSSAASFKTNVFRGKARAAPQIACLCFKPAARARLVRWGSLGQLFNRARLLPGRGCAGREQIGPIGLSPNHVAFVWHSSSHHDGRQSFAHDRTEGCAARPTLELERQTEDVGASMHKAEGCR
jgi:hypothetical protein